MWVKTKAGKNMPCDSAFVYYKERRGGKDRIVLPDGAVVAGTVQPYSEGATGYGYISHFATCKGTNKKKARDTGSAAK